MSFRGRQPRFHPDFRAAGSSALQAPSPPVEFVPKETGGMLSVRSVQMAAQAAFVSTDVRRLWKGQLCPLSQSSPPASLSSTDKGSEEGWLTLENDELKAPVAPFHRNSPFILFI